MTDELTICPKCGSDGCYKTQINETAYSYFDWGCGYYTNDLMKVGEFDFDSFEESLPELYKDVKWIDSENRVWYPAAINIPSLGTLFLNGKQKEEVSWCVIKVVPLTKKEKKEPRFKGLKYKSDPSTFKNFGNDFIEAADYLGIFNGM